MRAVFVAATFVLALAGCQVLPAPDAGRVLARSSDQVRIATWNINGIGAPGTDERLATEQILSRIDADVVVLQEVETRDDVTQLHDLAAELGYALHLAQTLHPVDRNAVLSRLPVLDAVTLDTEAITGDPDANELARQLLVVTIETMDGPLVVVPVHYKAGIDDDDEIRRAVEAMRTVQAVDGARTIVLGDFNQQLATLPLEPAVFTELPDGLASTWSLADDLAEALGTQGIVNDPFAPFLERGWRMVPTFQRDGSETTHPWSEGRLDYLVTTPDVSVEVGEIFHSEDEVLEPGLALAGEPIPVTASALASDHYPVFADLRLGPPIEPTGDTGTEDTGIVAPVTPAPGELQITEVMPNPDVCSDRTGEWVELENLTAHALSLEGLVLSDAADNQTTLGDVVVPAGGRVVLGRGSEPCGPALDGSYGASLSLNNAGDTLWLESETDVIDAPPAWGRTASGVSWQRTVDGWCKASTAFGSEWATPGAPNDCGVGG